MPAHCGLGEILKGLFDVIFLVAGLRDYTGYIASNCQIVMNTKQYFKIEVKVTRYFLVT